MIFIKNILLIFYHLRAFIFILITINLFNVSQAAVQKQTSLQQNDYTDLQKIIFLNQHSKKEIIKENRPPLAVDFETKTININTTFKGTELIIYGSAILQEHNKERNIIIIVQSTLSDFAIQKKIKIFGLWLPGKKQPIYNIPSFLYVAATDGAQKIAFEHYKEVLQNASTNKDFFKNTQKKNTQKKNTQKKNTQKKNTQKKNTQKKNTQKNEIIAVASNKNFFLTKVFGDDNLSQIVHNQNSKNKFWSILKHPIIWSNNGLFRTTISIPEKAKPGIYKVETYYYSQKYPLMKTVDHISITHQGVEAYLFNVAKNNSVIYALFCLLLAIIFGYLAGRFIKF